MLSGIFEWENELEQSHYPLTKDIGLKAVIIDASFQQFDNFIPVLKKIAVVVDALTITIQTDAGNITVNINTADVQGTVKKLVASNTRYLGCLTLGTGVTDYINNNAGTVQNIAVPFVSSSVRSVPSKAGVYTLEKDYGSLEFLTDNNLFFDVVGQTVTWNALHTPPIVQVALTPLKTINGVEPTNNAISVEDSDLLKVTQGVGKLTFSLANSVLNNTISPTQNYE